MRNYKLIIAQIICLVFESLENYLKFVNLPGVISHDVQRLSSLTYVTLDELKKKHTSKWGKDQGEYWNNIYNSRRADLDETPRVLGVKVGLKVENRDSGLKVIQRGGIT